LTYTDEIKKHLSIYAQRHGDDRLILGHRLSEWCGYGPILEEDLATTNTSLDLIGQSVMWLKYAAETDGLGKTEDDMAYLRSEREFKNVLLVEQQNEDFAYTTARQFFFDVYDLIFYSELRNSTDETLRGIAEKSVKESTYHVRHSSEWMLRLGDGTEESHQKIKNAVADLWMYTGELFFMDETDEILIKEGIAIDLNKVKTLWYENVSKIINEATLEVPSLDTFMQKGGRKGIHSENLGHILSELQYLKRAFPTAKW